MERNLRIINDEYDINADLLAVDSIVNDAFQFDSHEE